MSAITTSLEEPQSLFSSVMSFFVSTVHAEEAKEEKEEETPAEEEQESSDDKEEGGDEPAEEAEEEEEEEPEDPAPAIREKCENSKECKPALHHFKECEERVTGGKGWEGEDCVEELFHLMHCVDACSAPVLFKKLA